MRGINKVILVGNCGKDPDIRYTQSKTPVATLSIATSEQWTDASGEKQQRTDWHRVVCWNKLAGVCEKYLRKGRQVYIEGKLKSRKWKDNKGNQRTTTEVVADNLLMLGPKEEAPSLEEAIFGPGPDDEEEMF